MAIYKCKMCGGELSVNEGEAIASCDYCGTTQTVPSVKDENLQGLFNRANTLRLRGEFDKAEQLYEKIIQVDETQAEAYWGLILCKFGIEYVEDPATFQRVPTCHRTAVDSVIADDDYQSALQYADILQRRIYESEAREIERLQKEILALSQQEAAYDVFLCYKETDEMGKRTKDSVIANEIYYQLSQEGFRVFYAAITLEDKLGSSYEPCIFAALNSAKVMLAIGTKPEYFNAVWVKNEWSRFLKIIKKDRSKILIPCYKDMDAYDLPEEFAHLQAQDMNKIGFINDVVRGIKKVLASDPAPADQKEAAAAPASTQTAPLMQRVFLFLEDEDWASADEYCEKVLDLEPQNAYAYLGKLMAESKARTQADLAKCTVSFENNRNYQKAVRFADQQLKRQLAELLNAAQHNSNTNRQEEIYRRATGLKCSATTESAYQEAAALFETILQWKDAPEQARSCREKAEEKRKDRIYAEAVSLADQKDEPTLKRAIALLQELGGWRDSAKLISTCENEIGRIYERNESSYSNALQQMENGKRLEAAQKYKDAFDAYQTAQRGFNAITHYKDSNQHSDWCSQRVATLTDRIKVTLTVEIPDSLNPLSLANGTHYIYTFKDAAGNTKKEYTVVLGKGTTTHTEKLDPGNYTLILNVFGANSLKAPPLHSTSCPLRIAPFENWKLISNRPGLFSKLELTPRKQ